MPQCYAFSVDSEIILWGCVRTYIVYIYIYISGIPLSRPGALCTPSLPPPTTHDRYLLGKRHSGSRKYYKIPARQGMQLRLHR